MVIDFIDRDREILLGKVDVFHIADVIHLIGLAVDDELMTVAILDKFIVENVAMQFDGIVTTATVHLIVTGAFNQPVIATASQDLVIGVRTGDFIIPFGAFDLVGGNDFKMVILARSVTGSFARTLA